MFHPLYIFLDFLYTVTLLIVYHIYISLAFPSSLLLTLYNIYIFILLHIPSSSPLFRLSCARLHTMQEHLLSSYTPLLGQVCSSHSNTDGFHFLTLHVVYIFQTPKHLKHIQSLLLLLPRDCCCLHTTPSTVTRSY